MSIESAFVSIATSFSDAMGAPYYDALAKWPGEPVKDSGGAIITPGTPVEVSCKVQVDSATELMRREAQYRDGDVRLVIIDIAELDTDARIEILDGPRAGIWMIQTVSRDPAGIGFDCLGRLA